MAGFDHQVLTDVGWDALADTLAGKKLAFVHLEAGDGTITGGDAQLQGLTALVHKVMDFPITSFSDDGKGQVTLIGTLTSKNAPSAFYFRELGVKVTLDAGSEVLYSVSNSGATADYIPASTDTSTVTETMEIVVKIDRTTTFTVNVQAGANVTAQNIGPATAGAGPFRDKIGNVLNIKRLTGTGGAKVTETTDLMTVDVQIPISVPSGGMIEWPGITIPLGWLWADGSIKNVVDFPAMAAALGNRWGGDGVNTFGIPDTRSRVSIGTGQGAGTGLSTYILGQYGGAESVVLTTGQLPEHTHTASQAAHTHTVNDPGHTHTVNDPSHAHSIAQNPHSHHVTILATYVAFQVIGGGATGVGQVNPGVGGTDNSTVAGHPADMASASLGIYGAATGITNANATTKITLATAAPVITVAPTGASQGHPNIQPFYVVTKIIKI